ncbi:MAG: hypothetical protein ACREPB_11270 [Arenimonas sp.]
MLIRIGLFLIMAFASSTLSSAEKDVDYPLDPDITFVISGHTEKAGDFRIVVINLGYEHVSSRVRLEWLETGPEQTVIIKKSVWLDEIGSGMLLVGMPVWSPGKQELSLSATHTYSMEHYKFRLIPLAPGQYELKKIR